MASAVGDLVATLGMNTSPWSSAIAGARSTLDRFKQDAVSGLGQLKQAMSTLSLGSVGGAILGGGLLVGASKAVSMFTEAEQAGKKLEAVLKATGGAAGLSSKELMEYAGDLQKVTNFGDDATVAGMAVLATFTQIKGDVFKDAVASAQDLSAVMGQDLQSSMVQIGKALNDPIKGMTALRRVGVSFTEEQQRQIANLQKQGDLTGAQRMILAELNTEFGGSAKAMADPIMQAKEAMGDLAERIGAILKPAFTSLWQTANATMTRIVDGVEAVWERFSDVRQTIAELWGALSENPLAQGLMAAVPVLGVVTVALGALLPLATNIGIILSAAFTVATGPIGIAFALVAGVGAALLYVGVKGETMADKLQNVFQWMGESVNQLAMLFRNFSAATVLGFNVILLKSLDVATGMVGPFKTVVQVFVGAWAGAAGAFSAVIDGMQAKLLSFAMTARDSAVSIVSGFKAVAQGDWQSAMAAFGLAITNATGGAATAANDQAVASAAAFGDAFNSASSSVGSAIDAAGGLATGSIRSLIGMENAILMDQIRKNEAGFELRKRKQSEQEKTGGKKPFELPGLGTAGAAKKVEAEKPEVAKVLEKGSEEAWKAIIAATTQGGESARPEDRTADGVDKLAEQGRVANDILAKIEGKLEETSI